jgi:UDP-2-acetamido-2-deoxy-ribo-hexuluronate aminotransferase
MSKKIQIPLLDLKREYSFLKKDIDKELKDCFDSQAWVLGEKVSRFEEEIARYLGVKHAIGVASGTDALILSLGALAIKLKKKESFDKKDEIITTPFSFIATAEAIARCGATPVFVDINPDTFNIDPGQIKKAINKNTVGIIPVHLYGLACDMSPILKIAKENNLFVIEDTAQSFGGMYKEKKLGSLGDLGAFSFFPSKNLGCYGDGGLVSTNDSKLAELLRVLRNHGQTKTYEASFLGYNSRLDSIQAAVLLAKLKYIDKFNRLRNKAAKQYNNGLKSIKQIQTPVESPECFHSYHLYTIKVSSNRDKLLKYLNSKAIAARIYYPHILSQMKAFSGAKVKGDLKNTKAVLPEILTLPIHPFLKMSEISYIIKEISSFFSA